MCGNDANTYTNMCHLHKATCLTGIQLGKVSHKMSDITYFSTTIFFSLKKCILENNNCNKKMSLLKYFKDYII